MNVTSTPGPENIDTFILESASIAAGVVTAAVIVALVGYVLHLKQRRKNLSRESNMGQISGDQAGNDYSSLRRIMEHQTSSVSVQDNSSRIQSEEVYHEIDELQVLDVEKLEKAKSLDATFDTDGYLEFSQNRQVNMRSYIPRESSAIDGYLTAVDVKSRAKPTIKYNIEGYSA